MEELGLYWSKSWTPPKPPFHFRSPRSQKARNQIIPQLGYDYPCTLIVPLEQKMQTGRGKRRACFSSTFRSMFSLHRVLFQLRFTESWNSESGGAPKNPLRADRTRGRFQGWALSAQAQRAHPQPAFRCSAALSRPFPASGFTRMRGNLAPWEKSAKEIVEAEPALGQGRPTFLSRRRVALLVPVSSFFPQSVHELSACIFNFTSNCIASKHPEIYNVTVTLLRPCLKYDLPAVRTRQGLVRTGCYRKSAGSGSFRWIGVRAG